MDDGRKLLMLCQLITYSSNCRKKLLQCDDLQNFHPLVLFRNVFEDFHHGIYEENASPDQSTGMSADLSERPLTLVCIKHFLAQICD